MLFHFYAVSTKLLFRLSLIRSLTLFLSETVNFFRKILHKLYNFDTMQLEYKHEFQIRILCIYV